MEWWNGYRRGGMNVIQLVTICGNTSLKGKRGVLMAVQTMDDLVQSDPIDSGRIQLTAQLWEWVIEAARTIEPKLSSLNASQTLDYSEIAEFLPRERLGAGADWDFLVAQRSFANAKFIDATDFHNLVAWVIQATSVQQRENWLELWKQLTESRGNEAEAFETLARGWKEAHVFSSSASLIASHPDYQKKLQWVRRPSR